MIPRSQFTCSAKLCCDAQLSENLIREEKALHKTSMCQWSAAVGGLPSSNLEVSKTLMCFQPSLFKGPSFLQALFLRAWGISTVLANAAWRNPLVISEVLCQATTILSIHSVFMVYGEKKKLIEDSNRG